MERWRTVCFGRRAETVGVTATAANGLPFSLLLDEVFAFLFWLRFWIDVHSYQNLQNLGESSSCPWRWFVIVRERSVSPWSWSIPPGFTQFACTATRSSGVLVEYELLAKLRSTFTSGGNAHVQVPQRPRRFPYVPATPWKLWRVRHITRSNVVPVVSYKATIVPTIDKRRLHLISLLPSQSYTSLSLGTKPYACSEYSRFWSFFSRWWECLRMGIRDQSLPSIHEPRTWGTDCAISLFFTYFFDWCNWCRMAIAAGTSVNCNHGAKCSRMRVLSSATVSRTWEVVDDDWWLCAGASYTHRDYLHRLLLSLKRIYTYRQGFPDSTSHRKQTILIGLDRCLMWNAVVRKLHLGYCAGGNNRAHFGLRNVSPRFSRFLRTIPWGVLTATQQTSGTRREQENSQRSGSYRARLLICDDTSPVVPGNTKIGRDVVWARLSWTFRTSTYYMYGVIVGISAADCGLWMPLHAQTGPPKFRIGRLWVFPAVLYLPRSELLTSQWSSTGVGPGP